jgi:splicing factor 3B subunit 1
MFEYIGEMAKDYIYALTPLLEDGLIDRDMIHRQTACSTVKHLALGSAHAGAEDALSHLLNVVFPNVFEVRLNILCYRLPRIFKQQLQNV